MVITWRRSRRNPFMSSRSSRGHRWRTRCGLNRRLVFRFFVLLSLLSCNRTRWLSHEITMTPTTPYICKLVGLFPPFSLCSLSPLSILFLFLVLGFFLLPVSLQLSPSSRRRRGWGRRRREMELSPYLALAVHSFVRIESERDVSTSTTSGTSPEPSESKTGTCTSIAAPISI